MLGEDAPAKANIQAKTPKDSNTKIETEDGIPPAEAKGNTSLIIIIAASVAAGIAGWYFKIHKPKQTKAYDEEVDEAEYIDEEIEIEDEEIS